MSTLIKQSKNRGVLHGCKVSKRDPSVSHLLFADDSFFLFQVSVSECEIMNDILACYERDSGQAMNLQKSSIFFSTNVDVETQASIKQLLNVNNNLNTGRYLCPPSLIGLNKQSIFGFLRDRLWKRLHGWHSKLLS